jgi:hypothetical protein
MNTLPDLSIISSDARHMVRIGELIGTYEPQEKLKIASEEETLTSLFGGGIENLPPYEQRLPEEEWKSILGRRLEKKKMKKRSGKLKNRSKI